MCRVKKSKHNPDGPSCFFEILESRELGNESHFEFALPKNIYKRLLRLSGVTKQTISNVSLELGDCLTEGSKAPLLITALNIMGAFFVLF